MKIIQVLTHALFFINTGDERSIKYSWPFRFAKEILQRESQYEIECWHPERNLTQPETREVDGIKCRFFPSRRLWPFKEVSPLLVQQLREEAKREQILVHLHGTFSYITYACAPTLANVPVVASDFFNGSPRFGLVEAMRYRNWPHIIYNLSSWALEFIPQQRALRRLDHLFAINSHSRQYLSQLTRDDKVSIVTPGVDFERFRPRDQAQARESLGLPREGKMVLFVGVLVRLKGLDYLLPAFASILSEFPHSLLLLVGTGSFQKELERLVLELGLQEKVRFWGYLEHESPQLPLLYNAADVFVLPSWHESFGTVGVEALASGIPVIGTRVGGIPEVLHGFGDAGLLIPPRDSGAIAEALRQVFTSTQSFPINRERARQVFSWDAVIAHTLEVYQDLIRKYYGH